MAVGQDIIAARIAGHLSNYSAEIVNQATAQDAQSEHDVFFIVADYVNQWNDPYVSTRSTLDEINAAFAGLWSGGYGRRFVSETLIEVERRKQPTVEPQPVDPPGGTVLAPEPEALPPKPPLVVLQPEPEPAPIEFPPEPEPRPTPVIPEQPGPELDLLTGDQFAHYSAEQERLIREMFGEVGVRLDQFGEEIDAVKNAKIAVRPAPEPARDQPDNADMPNGAAEVTLQPAMVNTESVGDDSYRTWQIPNPWVIIFGDDDDREAPAPSAPAAASSATVLAVAGLVVAVLATR